MKPLKILSLLAGLSWLGGCAAGKPAIDGDAATGEIDLADPTGDDRGPGTYAYPTDPVYKPGCFDLTRFQVIPGGNNVEFRVEMDKRIEDPWDSKAWGGNGFSLQMAFVFVDADHVPNSGVQESLPGLNVRFAPQEAWDKVIILSPQGTTRVKSEIDSKAARWKDRIIVPQLTRASGKKLIAIVSKEQLGGMPQPGWGYQVLIQSNEGYPAKTDLLTRKVNEFQGQHCFGGGTDYNNDPEVLDLLVPLAKGEKAEVELQYRVLGKYNQAALENPRPEDLAVVPMVYPGS